MQLDLQTQVEPDWRAGTDDRDADVVPGSLWVSCPNDRQPCDAGAGLRSLA